MPSSAAGKIVVRHDGRENPEKGNAMRTGRTLLCGLIILAVAAGLVHWTATSFGRSMFVEYWEKRLTASRMPDIFEMADSRLEEMKKNLPRKQQLALRPVPPEGKRGMSESELDEMYAFALANPERPWHLWRWQAMKLGVAGWPNVYKAGGPRRIASDLSPEETEKDEEFVRLAEFLRDHDPDNLVPLARIAFVEARRGVAIDPTRTEYGKFFGEVVDAEYAARAAALIREAAGKKRFTLHTRGLTNEWLDILGTPGSLEEALPVTRQLDSTPIIRFAYLRDLFLRMVIEAERRTAEEARSGEPPPEGMRAYDLLHDMQTLSGLLLIDSDTLLTKMIAHVFMEIATDDGSRILRSAGQLEQSERLLARGRELQRPYLIADTAWMLDTPDPVEPEPDTMQDDAELLRDAKQLLEGRRQRSAPFAKMAKSPANGLILSTSIPGIYSSWPYPDPPVTLEELVIGNALEFWTTAKIVWGVLVSVIWIVVSAITLLGIVRVVVLRGTADVGMSWPGPAQAIAAAGLFGVAASLPGLAAAFAGPSQTLPYANSLGWLLFWNIWGILAAGMCLTAWIAVQRRRQSMDDSTPPPWKSSWFFRIAALCLAASIALAITAYLHIGRSNPWWLWVCVVMLPAALWNVRQILHFAGAMVRRNLPVGGKAFAGRLALAGLAGGLLVMLAAFLVMDGRARAYAVRDTLLIPRSADASGPWGTIGERLVRVSRDHARNVLQREGLLVPDDEREPYPAGRNK